MNLNKMQNLIKNQILIPQSDPEMIDLLRPGEALSLKNAFQIYRDAYFLKLSGALEKTFPGVKWVLGKEIFQSLCHKFIETQPAVNFDLLAYGKNFPEFIDVSPLAKGTPFLKTLASFEWHYKEVLHAPTPAPLTTEEVQDLLRFDDAILQFIEPMKILFNPFSIYEMWLRRDEPPVSLDEIQWNHPEFLMISKKQKKVFIQELELWEGQVLRSLQEGVSLNSALHQWAGEISNQQRSHFLLFLTRSGVIEDGFEIYSPPTS